MKEKILKYLNSKLLKAENILTKEWWGENKSQACDNVEALRKAIEEIKNNYKDI